MSTTATLLPSDAVVDDTVYRRELLKPGFLALLVTQFLTAFNDNVFRWLIVPIGQLVIGETTSLALGAVCFTLPYLLFAPTAGYLSDRYSKRSIIVTCKFAEIVLMLIGIVGIWQGNVYLLMFLIFCMGTQSALFSPARYGTIPELLSLKALSEGNGLMAMVTIIASASGMFAGLQLYQLCFGGDLVIDLFWPIAAALLGVAVLGFLVSLLVRSGPAADTSRVWNFNPVEELRPSLRQLFSDRQLARSALGVGCSVWTKPRFPT